MNNDLFFNNFGLLADATNSVPKLRELILQLAVQGRIAPQDPEDEPASELLREIEVEKKRLVKEGKIKRPKLLPEIRPEEVPFQLPEGWEWGRLGEVVSLLGDGIHGTPTYDERGEFFFINGNNLSDGLIEIKENTKTVSADEYLKNRKELNDQTVLVSINGTIGNVAFYNSEKVMLGKSVCYFNLFSLIDKHYIEMLIKSDCFLEYALTSATGSTIKNVSLKAMREFLVPLPPLAEQRRIVVNTDQLMALCDELEEREEETRNCCRELNKSAIHSLTNISTGKDLTKAWTLIRKNFDVLYNDVENVRELRQAILQLAVQGKLAPQEPEDQPASVLLEEIEAEKKKLMKEGKIRKSKPLPPIEEDEIPYELPEGWEWARLKTVSYNLGQKIPESEFTYVDVSAINKEHGIISKNTSVIKPENAPSRARKIVSEGTVIYSTVRPYLLNIAIIDKEFTPAPIVSTAFAVLHPFPGVLNKYIYYYLRSSVFTEYVESQMIGMAYPAISETKFYKGVIPLPPLLEQKRIVARVDQLMALCDELEAKLEQAGNDNGELMESVVHHLV